MTTSSAPTPPNANLGKRPYSSVDLFHEPFVLFGYLGAITQKLEFVTGVLILSQRQTALVAKQAAEVDVLTGGRLRLGIGVGWNEVEYEALGENFANRGRRSAEQIEVMRLLWTQEVVDYHGRYHHITHAGINPLPVQRPIPVWFGGGAPQVVRRIGRIGDGWFPQFQPDAEGAERIAEMRQIATNAGRNPADIGIEGRISVAAGPPRHLGPTSRSLGRSRRHPPIRKHHASQPERPRPAHKRHPPIQGNRIRLSPHCPSRIWRNPCVAP